jgi:hypothetical protein
MYCLAEILASPESSWSGGWPSAARRGSKR